MHRQRDRRHERRGAALGSSDRPSKPGLRQARGFLKSPALPNPKALRDITSGNNGDFAAAPAGCLHGTRQSERRGAARCYLK